MNCERCQELISDLLDGTLGAKESSLLNTHLDECLDCAGVRDDLESVLDFCRDNRGHYEAPPNEHALWLRIRNTIEATETVTTKSVVPRKSISSFLNRSWQLSFPQLAAAVSALVLVVALTTVVGIRRIDSSDAPVTPEVKASGYHSDRMWQQQQTISYWNNRIATNRARWSAQTRDTFDRNLNVIDQAMNDSLNELNKNPHDEVSEEMLNAAMNEKIALLKEFSELE
ncbi:MAG TPA: zf-HC2 domain-containing protein [Pyrinomonadaceae bacterium]|nr:zf-HC2 domain-containing protein [Pyrinomonadaceae bacterium]